MNANAINAIEGKLPPYSEETEQVLLGAIMLNDQNYEHIAGSIIADHFYRKEHQAIFQHISQLKANNRNVDAMIVAESLKNIDMLTYVGGYEYLLNLTDLATYATNVLGYAEIIKERYVLRELIKVSSSTVDSAYSPQGKSVNSILDEAEQKILSIKNLNRSTVFFAKLDTLVENAHNKILQDAQRDNKNAVIGIQTHYTELDHHLCGLQRGELVIVAGRPGIGKTSFALNLAENVAIKSDIPVAIFSLEMTAIQLTQRILSSKARVDQGIMKRGDLNNEDINRLYSARNILKNAPIYISETPGINVLEIRSQTRRLYSKLNGNLGVIIIDYVQIMSSIHEGKFHSSNRAQEIADISRALKSLALELNLSIILLSQLNREVEARQDKRPLISDLRESGALEQDADVIMLLYRDEYYNREDSKEKGIAEVNIAKNRNGSVGTIKLSFLNQYTRFDNLLKEYQYRD